MDRELIEGCFSSIGALGLLLKSVVDKWAMNSLQMIKCSDLVTSAEV